MVLSIKQMILVYRHRRLDTNEIFYVGIGSRKERPYKKIIEIDIGKISLIKQIMRLK